jgi:XTP/dITP diphosphohydrolase
LTLLAVRRAFGLPDSHGKGATDASNRALLLEKLEGVRGKERSARFRCVIVLARGGSKLASFSGTVEGVIINQEKGSGGFGYDPLFLFQRVIAKPSLSLEQEVKNSLSHRARALEGLLAWGGWSA